MRTRAALGSIFASIVVLTLGWQAGSAALSSANSTTSTSLPVSNGTTAAQGGDLTTGASGSSATSGSSGSSGSDTASSSDGVYTGSSISTRYGNVQVSITVSGGTITDVTAVHLTDNEGKSVQISNRAAPVLRQEVLAAQSANVSNVSGATYTTDAYLASVQSALDQAGL